jgi:plasmid stabilization system protein ParE
MSDVRVIFSPRAKRRLKEISAYLYEQQLSKAFVRDYVNRFETWLEMVLGQFPDPELEDNIKLFGVI